ncbi:uncharacterized protein LOC123529598 [Mercenaria mercenaria]|uniref:uncharacterized protein LOC123529598 n=1 Tax=Mercenaria mercenaria TaxID=6596 RepID=UPI001E1D4E94|nr:uncharacterized protein LOC123529598 [Mercenaria mercenaria]
MVFYCCVPNCKSSGFDENVSMHKFPNDERQIKVWKDRIRRSGSSATKDDFRVTASTRVCSKHFQSVDYVCPDAAKKRLKCDAVPSVFTWIHTPKRKSPRKRKFEDSDETDTASEGEERVHQEVQANIVMPCTHRFSMNNIVHSNPKLNLLRFYTGFATIAVFNTVLELIVPKKDRSSITYWDRRKSSSYTSGAEYFESDYEMSESESSDEEDFDASQASRTYKLSLEDEFLLTVMKLRLGLFNKDLANRFQISLSMVSRIFNTWINLIYIRLGSMKVFPHRDIISKHMTHDFKKQYPNVMLIIDCTELKIQMPSSLVRKSQTYSDYKSANTYKGLVGVDSRGGIMFVSHLYTGGISDKVICQRSGLFDLLKQKIETGELKRGDGIMADKGFTIANELNEIDLCLNIPPFLGKRKRLSAANVQDTHVIAHHRIHVERAIGKVRNFHIFDRRLPIKSAGVVNQIWTDCCLLSNFQDPLIAKTSTDDD